MPGMDGLQASRHIKSDETLTHPPAIVLVTAFGREEVREEAERLQLDGFLLKPVTKSMIVDTLVNVFARRRRAICADAADGEQATRLRGARILLAEDNEINQQIAVELLEGAGATVTVANNGREAVEMLSRSRAAAIRRRADGPADAGDGRLSGDGEAARRCALRGAADHRDDGARHGGGAPAVSRRRHERSHRQADRSGGAVRDGRPLLQARRRSRRHREQPSSPAPQEALPSIAGLDTNDGLARVGGNRKLYVKILRQFAEQQGPALRSDRRRARTAATTRLRSAWPTRSRASPATSARRGVQSAAAALER